MAGKHIAVVNSGSGALMCGPTVSPAIKIQLDCGATM